jgi:hypothetical protein
MIAVQIKCGPSYLQETTNDGYVFRGELKHLNYWVQASLPVILVLCDPAKDTCFWTEISPGSVTRLEKGWKTVVPFASTLDEANRWALERVAARPQGRDFVELALYRLVREKYPELRIAQAIEMPRDLWGFELLGERDGTSVLVTFVYKPTEKIAISDVDDVIKAREITMRGCAWDTYARPVEIIIFLVAHSLDQLSIAPEVTERLSQDKDMILVRAICSFEYGVSLYEVDGDGQAIELY